MNTGNAINMKNKTIFAIWILELIIIGLYPIKAKSDCCPQPPVGYDCYQEAPAILPASGQIHFEWYQGTTDMFVGQTHVTQYLAFYHTQVRGYTYEVQYIDDLFSGTWMAYARWTAEKDDIVTTFTPIYPCKPQRFFRVVAQAPPALSQFITQHHSNHGLSTHK